MDFMKVIALKEGMLILVSRLKKIGNLHNLPGNTLRLQIIPKIEELKLKLEECLLKDFVLDQHFLCYMPS